MIFSYLLLPVFFFVGLITSYEDVKYGKIKNKWIFLGACWGILVFALAIFWNLLTPIFFELFRDFIEKLPLGNELLGFSIDTIFLLKSLLNAVLALVLGFLMWRGKAWAAGDAKLFFVFSLLIPTTYYWKSFLPLFPSFALLVNIFIPLIFFLLIRSFFYFVKYLIFDFSDLKKSFKKKIFLKGKNKKQQTLSWKDRGVLLLGFLTIFVFVQLFQVPAKKFFNIDLFTIQMIVFPLLIIFSGKITNWLKISLVKKIVVGGMLAFFFVGFIVDTQTTFETLIRSAKMMAIFIAFLTMFRALINFYIERSEKKRERRSFPLAVWIFGGAVLTLFVKASILTLFLRWIYG